MAGPAIKTVTIADNASLSDACNIIGGGDSYLLGLSTPEDWVTAVITFQVSTNGTDYFNYENSDGNEVSLGSTPELAYRAFYPADFAGVKYIKVRSGTSAAPVNQTGGPLSISLVVRELERA